MPCIREQIQFFCEIIKSLEIICKNYHDDKQSVSKLIIDHENSIIHEAFCFRNIIFCELCQKIVLRKNFDDHLLKDHEETTCYKCNFGTESFLMKSHEKFCPKRLVTCEYCQIQLNADVISDHLDQCGSKTELCNVCNKYVTLKDMKSHVCQTTLFKKVKNSLSEALENDFRLALSLQSEEFSQSGPNENNCDVCQETTNGNEGTSNINIKILTDLRSENLENLLPCQFCQMLLPTEELFDHQINCQLNVSNASKVDHLKQTIQSCSYPINESNKQQASNSTNLHESLNFKSKNSYLGLNKPSTLKLLDCKSDTKPQNYIHLRKNLKHEIITRKNYDLPPLKEDIIRNRPGQLCTISSSSNSQIVNSTKLNAIPCKKNIDVRKSVNQLLNTKNRLIKQKQLCSINQMNDSSKQPGNFKSKSDL